MFFYFFFKSVLTKRIVINIMLITNEKQFVFFIKIVINNKLKTMTGVS